ncbi:Rpn family recombination-promoting nuclease/putative transposase [Cohnella hashimotonis]|uniref:Rpn family recombination-promoting nuclease/putative transposase n=1 Tax=Cohnella hashimotonis TaxID=2826895 RepID=A0ABT6TCC9_9BACL|nr:Rpn family recombination-promoting nuclease/putative transposase [Cohnella hashimotonis]MDI4643990.1 Rpn family recombination-promoting nuclease/putative transposase [Cohnella hashimotonis]
MKLDHDQLFKTLIRTFFKEFMELFFPDVAKEIDFSHTVFLSEEVATDLAGGRKGRVDLLIETRLRGEETLIIIHIEPQSYYEPAFAERMFLYASKLYETHRRRILPIAVFSHGRKRAEPDRFGWSFPFLDVMRFRYLRLQLKHRNWREFVGSANPVAAALLSSLGYNKSESLQVKLAFLRMLIRLELDPARMELLAVFFESYIRLGPDEEELLKLEVDRMKQGEASQVAKIMEWENSWWKQGRADGREEGREAGMAESQRTIAVRMLGKGMAPELIQDLTGLPIDEIERLRAETR